jgi:hypothetical protein
MLELSADTESVLSYLDEAVEGGLRKRGDVGVLLELGALQFKPELFNALTTSGTAVWKVYGVLKRTKPGDERYRLLEEEFGQQLNAMREQLASMMVAAPDETLQRFDQTYFGMTQGVIRNLVDLGHDLARIKDLQRGARPAAAS